MKALRASRWSSVPLPVCAGYFRPLWYDRFCDVEHFDRLLIATYVEVRIVHYQGSRGVTHLPRLNVKFKHELLLLQTFLIVAQLRLLTDD